MLAGMQRNCIKLFIPPTTWMGLRSTKLINKRMPKCYILYIGG